jgi:hypothetical protein
MMNWKGCGRKRWGWIWGSVLEFARRDWGKRRRDRKVALSLIGAEASCVWGETWRCFHFAMCRASSLYLSGGDAVRMERIVCRFPSLESLEVSYKRFCHEDNYTVVYWQDHSVLKWDGTSQAHKSYHITGLLGSFPLLGQWDWLSPVEIGLFSLDVPWFSCSSR